MRLCVFMRKRIFEFFFLFYFYIEITWTWNAFKLIVSASALIFIFICNAFFYHFNTKYTTVACSLLLLTVDRIWIFTIFIFFFFFVMFTQIPSTQTFRIFHSTTTEKKQFFFLWVATRKREITNIVPCEQKRNMIQTKTKKLYIFSRVDFKQYIQRR